MTIYCKYWRNSEEFGEGCTNDEPNALGLLTYLIGPWKARL